MSFIIELGSCSYGGQKGIQSAICKLSPNAWELGGHWCQIPEYEGLRISSSDVQRMSQPKKKEEISSSFVFLFYLGLNGLDDACPYLWEQTLFRSTNSKTNLFQKHPQDTPRNNVLSPIYPVKFTHKINNHFLKGADR